jgi:hypothetical protein
VKFAAPRLLTSPAHASAPAGDFDAEAPGSLLWGCNLPILQAIKFEAGVLARADEVIE